MNAPTTQKIWKRVSNLANDRPRLASGASRWTIESNASLAVLALKPTAKATSTAAPSPPDQAASSAASVARSIEPTRMSSSWVVRRTRGATIEPTKEPRTLAPTAKPRCHVGCSRMAKASRKTRKPTMARMRPMEDAARKMPRLRSSASSASPTGSAATAACGSEKARTVPRANTTMAKPMIHVGPPIQPRMTPGIPAASPEKPVMIDSLELASISSWSVDTVVGTMALLAMP